MGRNAAELRRDAEATGLFNGPLLHYVGDGYTVPWETATYNNVPIGFTMWGYKLYLDLNWKEFSRLHDWLYTPYGQLINATREEADDALQEELNTVSPPDALIVGNACRHYGAPYFGRSPTGYDQSVTQPLQRNMPVAEPPIEPQRGSTSMPIKVVVLFQNTTVKGNDAPSINYTSIQRTGGWSESFYGGDSVSEVIQLLKGPRTPILPLLQARAALLGAESSIIGVRLYAGGAGKGQLLAGSYSGNAAYFSDQPSSSLLCSATSTVTGQSRRFILGGVPDAEISGGEFKPDANYTPAMAAYFLALNGFGWLGQTSTGGAPVFEISATGVVTTLNPVAFGVGNIVTFKQITITSTGRRIGGKFVVEAIGPLNTNFKVAGWTAGAGKGGSVSLTSKAFMGFESSTKSAVRSTTRKIGRPFSGYRGRRSKKRRV